MPAALDEMPALVTAHGDSWFRVIILGPALAHCLLVGRHRGLVGWGCGSIEQTGVAPADGITVAVNERCD